MKTITSSQIFWLFIFILPLLAYGQCNLQAHFPLNGNALDISPAGNNGTIYSNPIDTTDRFGISNSALYFDGIDDYINTFTTYDYPERTVTFWFKPERGAGGNSILIHDSHTLSYGAFNAWVTSGDLRARAGNNGTLMQSNLPLNQWYHVALVRRLDSGLHYLDGNIVARMPSNNNGSVSQAYDKLVIGAGRNRSSQFFKGFIDDIKIWDCVLSPAQIDSIFRDSSAIPNFPDYPATVNICTGDSVVPYAQSDTSYTYTWSDGTVNRLRALKSAGIFSVTISDGTFSFYDTITVSLDSLPVPLDLDTSLCFPNNVVINYGNRNIDSVVWSDGNRSMQRTLNSSGRFAVALFNKCGVIQDSVRVLINNLPSPLLIDTSFCDSAGIQISYINSNANGVLWPDGDTSKTRSIKNTGTYLVALTNNCGTLYDTLKIDLGAPPPSVKEDTTLCGSPIEIGLRGRGSYSYLWSTGDTIPMITVNTGGTYFRVKHSLCGSSTDTFNVKPYEPLPDTNQLIKRYLCEPNDSVIIGFENLSPNISVSWDNQFQGGAQLVSQSGLYTLTLNNGCRSKAYIFEVINLDTLRPASWNDTILCNPWRIIVSYDPKVIREYRINGEVKSINSSFLINNTGNYIFEYYTSCGIWRDTMLVQVENCDCDVYLPNTFTPNSDGLNDLFRVASSCDEYEYSLLVYDRAGNLVYSGNETSLFWDGTFRGEPVSQGTYLYKLRYQAQVNGQITELAKDGIISVKR